MLLDDRIDFLNGVRLVFETSIFIGKIVFYDIGSNDGIDERFRFYLVFFLLGRLDQGVSTVRYRYRLQRQFLEILVNLKLGEFEFIRERFYLGDVIFVVLEDLNFLLFECNDKLEQVKCVLRVDLQGYNIYLFVLILLIDKFIILICNYGGIFMVKCDFIIQV